MILFRYFLKEHALPFCYALSILLFIFVMDYAVQLLDKILSKGLSPLTVLELFAISMAWILALAVPMAILIATLMTFGRMAADNEITALKACGFNPVYALVPVVLAAAVCAVMLIGFNNHILPDANHKAANLLSDISLKKPTALIDPGVLIRDFRDYALYVDAIDKNSGRMSGIRIFATAPSQDPATTVATEGDISVTPDGRYIKLTLFNGETHSISRKNAQEYFIGRFKKQIVFLSNVDTELRRSNNSFRGDREMDVPQMKSEIAEFTKRKNLYKSDFNGQLDSVIATIHLLANGDSSDKINPADSAPAGFAQWQSALGIPIPLALRQAEQSRSQVERVESRIGYQGNRVNQYLVEIQKKYSIPVTAIIFVLIGAPLGIMARRGGLTVGASYSIFFFIVYWIFLIAGEALADKSLISPFAAMWSGNIVIGVFGIILILLMVRDATGFSVKQITLFFRHLFRIGARPTRSPFKRRARSAINALWALPWRILNRVFGIIPAYIVRSFLGYVAGILIGIIAMFVVVDYIANLNRFEKAALPDIALFYLYYLPWIVQLVFPIVALLSAMAAIGGVVRTNELTAMKAAGLSIRTATIPLLILGALFSIGNFYLGEAILPQANAQRKELTAQLEAGNKNIHPKKIVTEQRNETRSDFYYFGNDSTVYHFDRFRTMPGSGEPVWQQTMRRDRLVRRIQAERMVYDARSGWKFLNGTIRTFADAPVTVSEKNRVKTAPKDSIHVVTPDSSALPMALTATVVPFDTLADSLLRGTPFDMVAQIRSPTEMSYWELRGVIDRARKRGENTAKYSAELGFKIAYPLMNFIVILIGIAIPAKAGRGGGAVLFGIGILLVFVYWVLCRFALAFSQNGHLPPLVGAWLGNVIFLILGLWLYRRAAQ